MEQMVDVFRTIQIMRGQRPGIVGNVVSPSSYTALTTSVINIQKVTKCIFALIGPVWIHTQCICYSVAALLLMNLCSVTTTSTNSV